MASIQRYFGVIGFCTAALLAPQAARATGEACVNDIDCKTDPSCGGEICDYTKGETCQPATAAGSGMEGWCTVDTDCKCHSEGAVCTLAQCSKTVAAGTGAGGASGSAGSGSSAAGSSAAGNSSSSGSSGCSVSGGMPRGSLGFAFGAMCAAALIGARRKRRLG
ncbi:MAG TPA: hypothetical protein VK745_14860 [Polyangiaceae bacterium]|jgi:hypothetical protein|nr:hypothetical protein [Polyangiaceae bacterium]